MIRPQRRSSPQHCPLGSAQSTRRQSAGIIYDPISNVPEARLGVKRPGDPSAPDAVGDADHQLQLAPCSSSVRSLPGACEKSHCGLSASCSIGTNGLASSIRGADSRGFQLGELSRHEPEHDDLAGPTSAAARSRRRARCRTPGTRRRRRARQRAARRSARSPVRDPPAPRVAAAHVRRHDQVVGTIGDHRVHRVAVPDHELVGVLAQRTGTSTSGSRGRRDRRSRRRPSAGSGSRPRTGRRPRLAIGDDEIVPEPIEVG